MPSTLALRGTRTSISGIAGVGVGRELCLRQTVRGPDPVRIREQSSSAGSAILCGFSKGHVVLALLPLLCRLAVVFHYKREIRRIHQMLQTRRQSQRSVGFPTVRVTEKIRDCGTRIKIYEIAQTTNRRHTECESECQLFFQSRLAEVSIQLHRTK